MINAAANEWLSGLDLRGTSSPAASAELSRIGSSSTERRRQPTTENTDAKRGDELKGLKLIPYEDLDKAQQYAEAGGTMPIVFTLRQSGTGGVWISPPLLDSSSDNFQQTFLYLISQGSLDQLLLENINYWFVGKEAVADIDRQGGGFSVDALYTDDVNTCPLDGLNVNCEHSRFNFLADPLDTAVGSFTHIRTVNQYTTAVGIRVKALRPEGSSITDVLDTYTVTVYRTNNDTGVTATVGTLSTTDDSSIVAISDTVSSGNYTYSLETTAELVQGDIAPETLLVEFRQLSNFPSSVDRTADYTDMTLLSVEANMFNLRREYSPPSELKQLHIFVRYGMSVPRIRFQNPDLSEGALITTFGPSNRFVDLVFWWFINSGKITNPNFTSFQLLDVAICARFNARHNISFHAYITSTTNFYSYVQAVAPMMLCTFYDVFGTYGMRPLLPLNNTGSISTDPLTPRATFTDSSLTANDTDSTIIDGSYSKIYTSATDRLPVSLVITYRGQDRWNLEGGQTVVVRYPGTAADAPQETFDMTAFCTDPQHATIFAKYTLATRKYSTHTVTFQTAADAQDLGVFPTDLIRISLKRTTSTGDDRTEVENYLVHTVENDPSGITTITAKHFPLNASGVSIISNDIINGSFSVTT